MPKTKFIEKSYDNGENTFDKNISRTKTRVNCLYRIIKSGRIIKALKIVTNSKRLDNKFPVAAVKQEVYLNEYKKASSIYFVGLIKI